MDAEGGGLAAAAWERYYRLLTRDRRTHGTPELLEGYGVGRAFSLNEAIATSRQLISRTPNVTVEFYVIRFSTQLANTLLGVHS
jgi:hypothetical protein